jgi:phosphinothricin acetyltransferase
MIRIVKPGDAAGICSIYNHYVRETAITFEEIPVSIRDMEGRIRRISGGYPFFIAEENGDIVGYTYLNTWKERSAYRFSAEITIYVRKGHEGKGLGTQLYTRMFESVGKTNLHTILSCITLPNDQSIVLHEKFGFKKTAQFNEIGFKLGSWLDVGYWVLIL